MDKTVILFIIVSMASAVPHFTVKDNRIYDMQGGERIFHGVNLVTKSPPYYD